MSTATRPRWVARDRSEKGDEALPAESSSGSRLPGSLDRPSRLENSSTNLGRTAANRLRNPSPIAGNAPASQGVNPSRAAWTVEVAPCEKPLSLLRR